MTAPLLAVDGLEAFYGGAHILFGVSLAVAPGEVVALLGRNGAGKSTTLKSIMGLVPGRRGSIRFGGREIGSLAPFRIARLGLGYVPEDRRIFGDLTVDENLEVGRREGQGAGMPGSHIAGMPAWTAARAFEIFPALADMRKRIAGRLSGGEQQMLAVARTLMGNPRLILMDEPSEGLAPMVAAEMASALAALKRTGLSILLSEQNLHFAGHVGDRAYVIEKGHIRAEGSMAAIAGDQALRAQYLAV